MLRKLSINIVYYALYAKPAGYFSASDKMRMK